MKQKIGLLLVIGLIVLLISNIVVDKIEENKQINSNIKGYEDTGINKGQLAPDITLTTLDGEEVKLSDFRGKNVVLNFWATWCPPCRTEMPHFQDYYEAYAQQENVVILAANATYNDKGADHVQKFVNSFDLTFPILLMPDDSIFKRYEILSMPSTFMIDTEGRIQYHITGALDDKAIREYVAKLD